MTDETPVEPEPDPTPETPDRPGDEGVPGPDEALTTDNLISDDPIEEGNIPPDRWSAGQNFGNTPEEQMYGESLDRRLAEEVPDAPSDQISDEWKGGPNPRAGRLVAEDQGAHTDTEQAAVAEDVGIDNGQATAEEAAMHVVRDDEEGGGRPGDEGSTV